LASLQRRAEDSALLAARSRFRVALEIAFARKRFASLDSDDGLRRSEGEEREIWIEKPIWSGVEIFLEVSLAETFDRKGIRGNRFTNRRFPSVSDQTYSLSNSCASTCTSRQGFAKSDNRSLSQIIEISIASLEQVAIPSSRARRESPRASASIVDEIKESRCDA